MIQRIQSLYLFVGAVLLSLCLFMPLWTVTQGKRSITLDAFNVMDGEIYKSTAYIGIGLIITILLSLYIIMQFKKRNLQMKLCLLNSFLIFGVIGLIYLGTTMAEPMMVKIEGAYKEGEYGIAFFFPSLAVLLNLLAMRAIKKDEELVRSADRMR